MNKDKIKILDCSIRDGGLINDHRFSDDLVRAVYKSLSKSKIDYMEMGYRSSKEMYPPSEYGAWKYCNDEKAREIIDGIESDLKLSFMVDAHRVKEQQFFPADKSPFAMIRTATYVKDIDLALNMVNKAHNLGYETTANIMAISKETDSTLIPCLKKLAASPVGTVYIVDSFGALYDQQVKHLTVLFKKYLPGKNIGIHCHNNLQMAFCNTITGFRNGATFFDGTLTGIGRGCGNCCLELLLGYFKNLGYDLMPVLKVIEDYFVPLRKEKEWGYIIPYMITGFLNKHPRSAIAVRKTKEKDNYARFLDNIMEKTG